MLPAMGYAICEQHQPIAVDPAITAAEIPFELADDPLRIDRYVGDRDFDYVSVHTEALSLGSAEPPAWHFLEALHAIAAENGASAISGPMGFLRDGNQGVAMAQVAPIPLTEAALETVCRNIQLIQEYFAPLPFHVETIASLFRFQGTMTETEFLSRVLERTGCGWLLDVTNVYANAVNLGFDPFAFLEAVLPIPKHIQLRLAGGFRDERADVYLGSRAHPIPDVVWDLYRHALVLGSSRVDAVFIEPAQNLSDELERASEIRHARNIAEEIEMPV
jgi:uncharacterized protein